MRIALFITMFFTLSVYGQGLKKPKAVYLMTEAKNIGYVTQTEVSAFDWLFYVESKYYEALAFGEGVDFNQYLPDLEKVHPSYRFIFEFARRSYIIQMLEAYEDDDEVQEDIRSKNVMDFNPDTCLVVIKRSGYKFYLSEWEQENLASKIEPSKFTNLLNMPVTGVSYDQVIDYISFIEDYANETKWMRKSDYNIKLRLPSREDWLELCRNNLVLMPENRDKGITVPDTANTAGPCPLYNYIPWVSPCHNDSLKMKEFGYLQGPVSIYSYNASEEGLYCLFGNVAEMTSVKGVAVGGSFMHYAYQAFPEETLTYTGPQEWLGFRYVGVLVEK